MAKKRRRAPRLLLSWSMRDQKRFIEAVERLQSLVNDMEKIRAALHRIPTLQTLLHADLQSVGPRPGSV
jgi:hypothetical protein